MPKECEYSVNIRQFDADLTRPLKLTSTRSNKNEDARRDMDGFDVDEILIKTMTPDVFEGLQTMERVAYFRCRGAQ
ncbi:hypothetical protein LCGC14_3003720 [marine sediment metagenome]|uniref:Uncharacterized protein n=1 Tax=marine sediment metagenome TaxID=412755 RepID=A0A0F8X0R2_9ZZZZ